MSKPRYHWWGYVKWVIRDYPMKKAELTAMKAMCITPAYSGMPGGGEPQRGVEKLALKGFSGQKKREFEAVSKAIEITSNYKDGDSRLKFITMVFFEQTHTLVGAGHALYVCERTAQEWHREFIRLVASFMGFLDE